MHRQEQNAVPTVTMIDLFADAATFLAGIRTRGPALDASAFEAAAKELLANFRRGARGAGYPEDAVEEAVSALVVAIDEAVLTSQCPFHEAWEATPLQVMLYHDHLAGDRFFDRFAAVRQRGAPYPDVAEIYHTCLSLGFKGRYAQHTDEGLRHLTQTVAIDIDRRRNVTPTLTRRAARKRQGFLRRRRAPAVWIAFAVLALGTMVAVTAGRMTVARQPALAMSDASKIRPPVAKAWIRISLP